MGTVRSASSARLLSAHCFIQVRSNLNLLLDAVLSLSYVSVLLVIVHLLLDRLDRFVLILGLPPPVPLGGRKFEATATTLHL